MHDYFIKALSIVLLGLVVNPCSAETNSAAMPAANSAASAPATEAALAPGLSRPAPKLPNLFANAVPAAWTVGDTPPKPWQIPNSDPEITTLVVEREGVRWVELKDDSTEKAASLRQQFQPLKAGRLSFRIAVANDHIGQIGIFLGQGNASAEVERIVELKMDSRGVIFMGSAGKREKTAVSLTPGTKDHLFIEFSCSNENLNLRLGRIEKDGTDTLVAESTVPQQGHAVSRLRIATDLAPRGGHFYVTDLVLTAAPAEAAP